MPPPRTGRARPRAARARRAPPTARRGRGRWSRRRSGSPWPSVAWPPWRRLRLLGHAAQHRDAHLLGRPGAGFGSASRLRLGLRSGACSGGRRLDRLRRLLAVVGQAGRTSRARAGSRPAPTPPAPTATTAAIGQARLVATGTGRSACGSARLGLSGSARAPAPARPAEPAGCSTAPPPRAGRPGTGSGRRVGLAPSVEAGAQLAVGLHAPEHPDQRRLGQAGLAGQPRGQLALLEPGWARTSRSASSRGSTQLLAQLATASLAPPAS